MWLLTHKEPQLGTEYGWGVVLGLALELNYAPTRHLSMIGVVLLPIYNI